MANGKSLQLDSRSAAAAGTPDAVVASARAPALPRGESPGALALGRLRRSRTAVVAMVTIAALILVAAGADVLAPHSPVATDANQTFAPPSWEHPFGTDQLGRDMLSRVIHGTRISLAIGVCSVLFALAVGVPLGLIAGYYGGGIDTLVMRVMDLVLAFPIYLLAIILMVIFTPTAGLVGTMKVVGAIAIVRVPIYARLVRGSALAIKPQEYIEAGRALGLGGPRILLRHVLPNSLAPIIVTTTLGIATAIIVEATLSFLGLGTQPPTPSWGWDLKANVVFIQAYPWLSVFPGAAIFVTVLAFNLFGDGLRDALDPRLK